VKSTLKGQVRNVPHGRDPERIASELDRHCTDDYDRFELRVMDRLAQQVRFVRRAPFSIYRIARAVALGDPFYEIRFGKGDIPGSRRLEFFGPDGILHGWIILNARKEPLVWATTQYRYTFGPLKRFGNLRVPDWAVQILKTAYQRKRKILGVDKNDSDS
jgi:hypothetical protein